MNKAKFQEQMQTAIALWSLEACHSVCRRASAAGKTIDEINEWIQELSYFVDNRDFEWVYKNLKGQPEEREHLTEVRNFFQSLKELGFKYGEDFTMEPDRGLVISDKLRASVDRFIKIGNQFNTISNYQDNNKMLGKILDFLLPIPSESSSSSPNIKDSRESMQVSSQTRYASVSSEEIKHPAKANASDNSHISNLKLNDAEAETYLKQGYAYITSGNVQAAFESYNKAVNIAPNFAGAYCGRGYAYHELRHYQEAIADYSQAIRINSDCADAYGQRAFTRSVIGDTQGAVEDAEKAAEIYLKQNNINNYNQTKGFIIHIQNLKSVHGESLNMHTQLQLEAEQLYNIGNTLAMSGQFQEALETYDRAIALNKSNPMYFNNRASTLKRLGRMEDALAQYNELIKLHPSYGKAYLSRASTCIELNAYSDAVSSYKNFLLAYKLGQFSFNSVVGGKNQTVQGENELKTILFTSINYLLPEQQKRAIEAFDEATSQSNTSNFALLNR